MSKQDKKHSNTPKVPVCPYCGNELPQYIRWQLVRCHFCNQKFDKDEIIHELLK